MFIENIWFKFVIPNIKNKNKKIVILKSVTSKEENPLLHIFSEKENRINLSLKILFLMGTYREKKLNQ